MLTGGGLVRWAERRPRKDKVQVPTQICLSPSPLPRGRQISPQLAPSSARPRRGGPFPPAPLQTAAGGARETFAGARCCKRC